MKKIAFIVFVIIISISSFAQHHNKQKNIAFGFSIPLVNNLTFYDYDMKSVRNKTCFFGLGLNLAYEKGKNLFSLGAGFVLGPSTVPPFVEVFSDSGTAYNSTVIFADLLYHRKIYKGLTLAAGFNFINYLYNFRDYADLKNDYHKDDKTIGITAAIEYNFLKNCWVGFFYRPAIISFNKKQYWHVISLETHYNVHIGRRR